MDMIPANLGEIIIRYLRPEDSDSYIALEMDAAAKRYLNGPSKKSEAELRGDIKRYIPSNHLLVIADAKTDNYLGRCGFLDAENPNEKELYLVLSTHSKRKGLGKIVVGFLVSCIFAEGFKPVAYVDPGNSISIKFFRELGWINTGAIEKKNYQQGHLVYVFPKEKS